MSESNNWGGKRPGAGSGGKRPGAGRPKVKFNFDSIGSAFVIERGMVNDVTGPPEVWEIVNVTNDFFELQIARGDTTEIMTISKIDFWNGDV